MRVCRVFSLLVAVIGLSGISLAYGADQQKIRAFVSILPQAFFVSQVGGPHVDVRVLVDPGKDPHTFELTPKVMIDLSQADLFFALGLPFEQAIMRKLRGTTERVRIIDTANGVALLPLLHDHEEGEHGSHHKGNKKLQGQTQGSHSSGSGSHSHSHDASTARGADKHHRDPHIWLDPSLVKIQASNIAQALINLDPGRADDFRKNLERFHQDLDELDAELAESLSPFRGQRFYVYHPAFGYFAARYGLDQMPVEIEGKEPSPRHLTNLIRSAKKDHVKIIFVQPQFSQKTAQSLSEAIKGSVIAIDALSPDYLNNMRVITERLGQALHDGTSRPPR
ncbi:MAG: zinc transport system substrate-binding protein [Thermodesulfobacteriota bacterium]|nr:zinc transport system substrate-binding protein [Thermodesulfobacteriota bacterium]